jgi:hypothetical protein
MIYLAGSDVGVSMYGQPISLSYMFQFFQGAGAIGMHHELINVTEIGDGNGLITATLTVSLASGPPVLGICKGVLRLSDQLLTHLSLTPLEADAVLYTASKRARSKAKAFVQTLDSIFSNDRASFPALFAAEASLSWNGQAVDTPENFIGMLPPVQRLQSYVEDAFARADGGWEFNFMCKVYVQRRNTPDMITRSTWILNSAGLVTSFASRLVTDAAILDGTDGLDARVSAFFVNLDEIANALIQDNFRNPTAFFSLWNQSYSLSMFGFPTNLIDFITSFRTMQVTSVHHTVDATFRAVNDPSGVEILAKTTVEIGFGDGSSMLAFCNGGLIRHGNKLTLVTGAFTPA